RIVRADPHAAVVLGVRADRRTTRAPGARDIRLWLHHGWRQGGAGGAGGRSARGRARRRALSWTRPFGPLVRGSEKWKPVFGKITHSRKKNLALRPPGQGITYALCARVPGRSVRRGNRERLSLWARVGGRVAGSPRG